MTEQDKDRLNAATGFKDATTRPSRYPPEIEAERQKLLKRERRMRRWLDTIPPKDFARLVGEKVLAQMKHHDRERVAFLVRAWSNGQSSAGNSFESRE